MKNIFFGIVLLTTQLFGLSVTTNAATNITETSATLNGDYTIWFEACNIYFEWGTESSLGGGNSQFIYLATFDGSSINIASAISSLTGLSANTTYYYRLIATNTAVTQYLAIGFTVSFNTLTGVPSTPTGLTAAAGNTQVTLTWNANSESDLASYKIYGGTDNTSLSFDGDDDFNFPAVKEIIAFIGAFFLGMFVSDMKNRSSETQE